MRLYLASGNSHKAAEFQALCDAWGKPVGGARVEILGAAAAGGMPPVVEDAGSFLGNAVKKARALHARLPPDAWSLADDSGICVEALGGEPGVESAYYAGPGGDSAANLAKLVEAMRGVPDGRRSAEYRLRARPSRARRAWSSPSRAAAPDRWRGSPAARAASATTPSSSRPGMARTMAELAPGEKNRISHRGLAWAQCVGWLAARG